MSGQTEFLHPRAATRRSRAGRAAALGGVILGHALLLTLLSYTSTIPPVLPMIPPIHLLPPADTRRRPPPPPPPPLAEPRLETPPSVSVPVPDIAIASPVPTAAPGGAIRPPPTRASAGHFGAAAGAGLGLDVAALSGGGAGTRRALASFEALVRARVLAGKRQPRLAWDRRNSCMINYRVTVSRSGGLAGFAIEPCAIAEINEAARDAIRHAALPVPPDLGAPATEVHGSLIFQP